MTFDELGWTAELKERAKAAGASFEEFVQTIAALRNPTSGCPWDLEQDHRSLRRFLLEEAYEAAEAMLADNDAHLIEELGDVLLQVVLNAQLTSERGVGDIAGVIKGINEKMRRRHPHVFDRVASEGGLKLKPSEVKLAWEAIKKAEKKPDVGAVTKEEQATFAREAKIIPALTQAYKIGKKARRINFDWKEPLEVLAQLRSEINELESELKAPQSSRDSVEQELGDVFFTLAQLARHLNFEPEAAAQAGNSKFLKRFEKVEALAREDARKVDQLSQAQLEELWHRAKS